jgi:hypothetical protein
VTPQRFTMLERTEDIVIHIAVPQLARAAHRFDAVSERAPHRTFMIRTTGIKQHFKRQAALQEASSTSRIKPHFKQPVVNRLRGDVPRSLHALKTSTRCAGTVTSL